MTIPAPFHKLVLGTVQIGLDYGVSNRAGLMPFEQASDLLRTAYDNGCRTLDTAQAYGVSEKRLGEIGVERFDVISKLAHLPGNCSDFASHVYNSVTAMLARVRVPTFEGVLLHNPRELLSLSSEQVSQVTSGFERLKREGLVRKYGISVYCPEDLTELSAVFPSDLVQLPCCPLDTRWAQSSIVGKLRASGVEIHVRSVFLQGLMLMTPDEMPAYFAPWRDLFVRWRDWTYDHGMSPLEACLRISLHNPLFDKLVVGAQSRRELEEQLRILETHIDDTPVPNFGTTDIAILDPSQWKT